MSTQRRVVLHVGAPKSGTTFLQRALWGNYDALRSAGFVCAGERQRDMFHAAVEIRQGHEFWGYSTEAIDGTWKRLCQEAKRCSGTTIMSHELLAAASDEQAKQALAELDGVELHVVFTARDLARQATSEWQERVKNGSTSRFGKFQRRIVRQIESGQMSGGFWRNQDPLGVLARWAEHLPPEQVHVVVAPPAGADPRELWRRFGAAIGFDADHFDPMTEEAPANQALGSAQVAVLRRVNKALGGRIKQPAYAQVVKTQFAENLLAAQASSRPETPRVLVRRMRAVAQQRNEAIAALGYQVHGDLAELLPRPVPAATKSPDQIDNREVLDAFALVVAELLVHRADNRSESLLRRAATTPGVAPLRRRIVQRLRG